MLKSISKFLSLAILAFVAISPTSVGHCSETHSLSPVAYVDDQVITNYDVVKRAELIQRMSGADDSNSEAIAAIKQEAIKNLIDTAILNLESKKLDIKIPESQVKTMLEDLAKDNQMSYHEFIKNLQNAKIDLAELKSQLRSQILYRELVINQIGENTFITNTEKLESTPFATGIIQNAEKSQREAINATNPYQRHFTAQSKAYLAEISINNEENMEEIQKRLQNPKNFGDVAKQFSENPTSANNNGEIGWLPLKDLDHAYVEAILHTKIGGISKPFKLKDQIIIIKLLDLEGVTKIPEKMMGTKESVESILQKLYQNNEVGALTSKMRKDHLIRIL